MDLWFCHKPHEERQEEESDKKGFGARSRLDVGPGVGFVDLMGLLVHQDDCINVKVSAFYCPECYSLATRKKSSSLFRHTSWSEI
jgi:hypothetical protein